MRQRHGFQGRVGKPEDTCYAFWIGASLRLLQPRLHLDDWYALKQFLGKTSTTYGGFGKDEHALPDLMHSYLGLAGWSLHQSDEEEIHLEEVGERLRILDPALNVSQRVVEWMKKTSWH